ncbi:MAG: helix-turn-helix domain-containing protein [Actinomycetota bacterium]|nr:helix-turn-helix domain-containing protein [Actinomycetota bacterium]
MTVAQRLAAVAWFEQGLAEEATARLLGVARNPVRRLYHRWRVRGAGALVTKPTKSRYSFEFKLDLVQQLLAGEESMPALAAQAGLSSPKLLENWVRAFRRDGPDGLRPKTREQQPTPELSGENTDE